MVLNKTEEQWKQELGDERYHVMREKGDEMPFSGEYENHFENGTYACAACGVELFDSGTKFDAHCGWPSFYDAKPGTVTFHDDDSFNMHRTEVRCANCESHLGHVFEGEGFGTPTDQRFCIVSIGLKFTPKK